MSAQVPDGFPKLKGETRPWQCKKGVESCTRVSPCPSCRGARNRRSGLRKQWVARKAVEAATGTQAGRYASQTGNEELWRLLALIEAKSGKQCAPTARAFLKAEAQAEAARAIGDTRPFWKIDMPEGWGSDGIISFRIRDLEATIHGLVNL